MEVYIDDIFIKSVPIEQYIVDLKETFEILRRYNMTLNPLKCMFKVVARKFLEFVVSSRRIEANPKKIKAILEMSPPKLTREVHRLVRRIVALNRFISNLVGKCLISLSYLG